MPESQPLRPDRYKAAYGVALAGIRVGKAVRILSLVVAGIVVATSALAALGVGFGLGAAAQGLGQSAGSGALAAPALLALLVAIAGIVLAVLACAPAFLLGVLIESTSEMLLASLDTAVNTSPFLGDEQKLAMMRL